MTFRAKLSITVQLKFQLVLEAFCPEKGEGFACVILGEVRSEKLMTRLRLEIDQLTFPAVSETKQPHV